jgi:hypothetical protein
MGIYRRLVGFWQFKVEQQKETQNLLPARAWGFESLQGHQSIQLVGSISSQFWLGIRRDLV